MPPTLTASLQCYVQGWQSRSFLEESSFTEHAPLKSAALVLNIKATFIISGDGDNLALACTASLGSSQQTRLQWFHVYIHEHNDGINQKLTKSFPRSRKHSCFHKRKYLCKKFGVKEGEGGVGCSHEEGVFLEAYSTCIHVHVQCSYTYNHQHMLVTCM